MDHGEYRIALSAKVRVDTKYKADENTVDAVTPQVFRRHGDNRRVFGKKSRERLRQKL